MPRQSGTVVENNFIKGLITETTPLKFPSDGCTETFNCIFDVKGEVTRRPDLEFEDNVTSFTSTANANEVLAEYVWKTVSGSSNIAFVIVQKGAIIHFYGINDAGDTASVSQNKKSFTIDLAAHRVSGSGRDPGRFICQFASGNGRLVIVNRLCYPMLVAYDVNTDSISTTDLKLLYRDFVGLNDGLTLLTRPTSDVPTLKTNNPNHYYNLINQGWHSGDALAQWDTARADLPSNADMVILYRASATDAFDNSIVTAKTGSNTPAPKGHFTLEVGAVSRTNALTSEGFTGATVVASIAPLSGSTGTLITPGLTGVVNASAAFDTNTSQTFVNGANTTGNFIAIGRALTTTSFRVQGAVVYGSTNAGFSGTAPTDNFNIKLYGKQGFVAPTTSTDGTLLGTLAVTPGLTNESAGRTVTSSDVNTFWDFLWVVVEHQSGTGLDTGITEVKINCVTNDDRSQSTSERPTCVAFFSSRVWYGGIQETNLSSNIYFSRIIQNDEDYAKCYQQQDPTSEDFFDLLPDDGGVIRIPEMGRVVKLFPYQTSLVVLATNGVWLIGGSIDTGFAADSFTVRKISSVGTSSPLSVVDVKGVPFWWAEDSIYSLNYKADYNSFEVTSVITQTIQTFFDSISRAVRDSVKGTYDTVNFKIYWLYGGGGFDYTNILTMDLITGAFSPWTIPNGGATIRGLFYLDDPAHSVPSVIKFITIYEDAGLENLTFSEFKGTSFIDWNDSPITATTPTDYESYFISGYRIDGGAQRHFQSNYLYTYFDLTDDGSCFVQGIWDWTDSPDSGKWSVKQQVYNYGQINRRVTFSRRKIRGKGRALQLKYSSETGKPFRLIGWTIWETINSAL